MPTPHFILKKQYNVIRQDEVAHKEVIESSGSFADSEDKAIMALVEKCVGEMQWTQSPRNRMNLSPEPKQF